MCIAYSTVADTELQIRGWGGGGGPGHPAGDKVGRGGLQTFFFRTFGPQFGLKIRGAAPPGPSPGSATVTSMPHERQARVRMVKVKISSHTL